MAIPLEWSESRQDQRKGPDGGGALSTEHTASIEAVLPSGFAVLARVVRAVLTPAPSQDYREIDRGFLGAGRAVLANGGFGQSQLQPPWNAPVQSSPGTASEGFPRLSSDKLNGSFSSSSRFSNDGSTVISRRNGELGNGWDLLPVHATDGGFDGFGATDASGAAVAMWSFGSPERAPEHSVWGGNGASQQTQGQQNMAPRWADAGPHRHSAEGTHGPSGLGGLQMHVAAGGGDGNGFHYLSRQPSAPAAPPSRQQHFHSSSMPYMQPQQQQQVFGEYPVSGGISGTASDPDVLGRQLANLGLVSSDMLLPAVGFEEQQRQQHLIHLQLMAKQPPAMDAQPLQQGRHPASPGTGMHGGGGNGVIGGGYGHLLGSGAGLDMNVLRREGSVSALPVRSLSDPSRIGLGSCQNLQVRLMFISESSMCAGLHDVHSQLRHLMLKICSCVFRL